MKNCKIDIKEFIESHKADDVIYALSHPEYFGLTEEESIALHAWVFKVIDQAISHSH